ncbi:MAG: U32 family peptidase [bacterium]
MKIIAPISSPQELEMLLHHGADELYCGVRTPEWEEHFGGQWWMNRRSPRGANLASWQEIREVVQSAHSANVPVHVTLNAPFYTEAGLRYLLKLAEKLSSELGVDGLIVSDLSFLLRLSRLGLPVRVHLSSLGNCLNTYSAGFFESLGIRRVILPRQLRLSEIRRIVAGNRSPMEFEVFAVNDGCFFDEAFCQTTHVLGGPFCLTEWKVEVRGSAACSVSQEGIEAAVRDLREYLWYQNNCGSSLQDTGLPNGPCSLCWFGWFRDWGVTSVKIVGREASFARKMGSLQLVKAVMDEVRAGASPQRIAETARSLRRTPEYCDKGYMCYFREE